MKVNDWLRLVRNILSIIGIFSRNKSSRSRKSTDKRKTTTTKRK